VNNLNNDSINEIISLVKDSDLELALNKVKSLLLEFPSSDILFNLRGTIFLKKKEYKIAQSNFSEALNYIDLLYFSNVSWCIMLEYLLISLLYISRFFF